MHLNTCQAASHAGAALSERFRASLSTPSISGDSSRRIARDQAQLGFRKLKDRSAASLPNRKRDRSGRRALDSATSSPPDAVRSGLCRARSRRTTASRSRSTCRSVRVCAPRSSAARRPGRDRRSQRHRVVGTITAARSRRSTAQSDSEIRSDQFRAPRVELRSVHADE